MSIQGAKILKLNINSLENWFRITENNVEAYFWIIETASENYLINYIPSGLTSEMIKCGIVETRYVDNGLHWF